MAALVIKFIALPEALANEPSDGQEDNDANLGTTGSKKERPCNR